MKDPKSTSPDNVSQLQSFLTTVQYCVLEPCVSGKHARCAQCTFRERVFTPSTKRKVFSLTYHKVMNNKGASDKCCACSTRDEG